MPKTQNRITTTIRDGKTVYSVSAWPGWETIFTDSLFFMFLTAVLVLILAISRQVSLFIDEFFTIPWLNKIIYFIVASVFDLSFVVLIVWVLLWIPYFLIYELSPKRFWLEQDTLCHTVSFMGLIKRTRKIHFDRIMDIKISPSGSKFHLSAVYEMKLPRIILVILVHWNERFTQWPLTIVNAIPTKAEAEKFQTILLEPMTKAQ